MEKVKKVYLEKSLKKLQENFEIFEILRKIINSYYKIKLN